MPRARKRLTILPSQWLTDGPSRSGHRCSNELVRDPGLGVEERDTHEEGSVNTALPARLLRVLARRLWRGCRKPVGAAL